MLFTLAFAQIRLAEDRPPLPPQEPISWSPPVFAPFDSTYYRINEHSIWYTYKIYIGQRLFLPRCRTSYQILISKSGRDVTYGGMNKYYEIIGLLNIESEEFVRHSALRSRLQREARRSRHFPYFVLRETVSGDTVFTGFPRNFILVGGFVRMQQEYIGENIFQIRQAPTNRNINENLVAERWECIDVVVHDGRVRLLLQSLDNPSRKIDISRAQLNDRLWTTERAFIETLDTILAEMAVEEQANRERQLQRERENAALRQQREQERAQAEAARRRDLTARFGAATANQIIAGNLEVGMNRAVVREIVGTAAVVDRTETRETRRVHNIFFGGGTLLFFERDRLTRIVNY